MSSKPKKSRKSATKKTTKTTRSKKTKAPKRRAITKVSTDKTIEVTAQEVVDKTINDLNRLGAQLFALSPFSQYFDDWLNSLRQVLSSFESNPILKVDAEFTEEQSKLFTELESKLSDIKLAESVLTAETKALSENNQKIVELDRAYSQQTRELTDKRNSELQRLNNKIRQLQEDISAQREVKIGFFKFKEKRLAAEKLSQTIKDLEAAKKELDLSSQQFTIEQEKLHVAYEEQKNKLSEISNNLHQQLEKLETDESLKIRQTACTALSEAVKALFNRKNP